MIQTNSTFSPQAEDFAPVRQWALKNFSLPCDLPFSFQYAGQSVAGIPTDWQPKTFSRRLDANLIETVYEGHHPSGCLEVRVESLEYQDFPVVEWVVWFKNTGETASDLIEDIRLDAVFDGHSPALQHCNGDFYHVSGYTTTETQLSEGQLLQFAPTGGRPCDGAFPYFRLQFAGYGLCLAVGWPGQWSASFQAQPGKIRVSAGQENIHLRLMPGEMIRSPRITLLTWNGETLRGVNLWRRWYLAHILPRPHGQLLRPRLACAATEDGEEFTNANEENQLRLMRKFKQAGIDFDVWWIDAGWYPCRNEKGQKRWPLTGTWIPDPERFPAGFRSISEQAQQLNAELLIWFEPERVAAGSWLDRERPDWLLKTRPKPGGEPDPNRLLDLGNPACRTWLTDHICQLIRENGINIYRQDFNFPPLDYWRDNDAEDRQGIHENLHVQGYLQFWDDLLARNPGLWIDSCSSGGRRNDLETMRRSVPLHYTDYGYGDHAIKLAFHHTMFGWIPYFKECTLSWDVCQPGDEMRFDKVADSFSFHCGMAPMLFATLDIRRNHYDFDLVREMVSVWRTASIPMLYGDYIPLTPFSKDNDQWVAWHFEQPETRSGILQGIRLADSPDELLTIFPHVSDQTAVYMFENSETKEQLKFSAQQLLSEGFTFTLPARHGAIWFYTWNP